MKQLNLLDLLEKKKRLEALWLNSDPLPWEDPAETIASLPPIDNGPGSARILNNSLISSKLQYDEDGNRKV